MVDASAKQELGIVEGEHGLMLPPAARAPKVGMAVAPRPKALVLDEEEWAAQLEAIIERDFFPDIPKLQSKLEWLQALRSRDPAALRQAQANIAARRAGLKTPIGATPGSFETPGASLLRAPHLGPAPTPSMTPLMGRYGDSATPAERDQASAAAAAAAAVEAGAGGGAAGALPMTLDRFLAKHTSEDNASFAELLADMNARRWARAPWLLTDRTQGSLEGDGPVDEQGHMRALTWEHEPRNRMFYDGSQHTALRLSAAEQAQRVAGPPKAIMHRNTRFVAPVAPQSGASTPGGSSDGGGGATPAGVPGQHGGGPPWSVVATPSLTPGADGESPFMTWGDIAGTPVRLDSLDTPEGIGGSAGGRDDGPRFAVPGVPRRESITRRMAAKASTSLKRKAHAYAGTPLARQAAAAAAAATGARGASTPGAATPLKGRPPRSSGAKAVRPSTPLSEAGQKLAASLRARGGTGHATPGTADRQLRASYGHTPSCAGATPTGEGRVRGLDSTPMIGAKEAARLARLRQAALDSQQRKLDLKPGAKLTDDLLDL